MTVTEPGIAEIRIERERNADGGVDKDYKYRRLRIVGESGAHIVIERVSLAGLRQIAATIREHIGNVEEILVVMPKP